MGIWIVSILGATLRKLRDDANDASFSPDGSQIAFTDIKSGEIWLMNADSGHARSFIKPNAGFRLFMSTWFPNGRRLAYLKWAVSGQHDTTLESRDIDGSNVVLITGSNYLGFWLDRSGRSIYSQAEPPPNQYDSNLWELGVDLASGKPRGNPRRLTDWKGYNFYGLSMTSDSKHMVFNRGRGQSAVLVMELSRDGKEAKPAQRLTFDERVDWPTGWLQDGKTVLFYSDRAGSFDIYKQRIDQHDAEAIVTGPDDKRQPQLSPDGRWILYMQWPKTLDGNFAAGGKIMRVPVVGGAPEGALEIKSHPQVAAAVWVVFTAPGLPSFACARHAGGDCVFAEVDGNKIAFTLFDPVQGEKQRPLRVAVTSPDEVAWDLSPDGSHIAISNFDFKTAEVQIIPLACGAPQKLSALP